MLLLRARIPRSAAALATFPKRPVTVSFVFAPVRPVTVAFAFTPPVRPVTVSFVFAPCAPAPPLACVRPSST